MSNSGAYRQHANATTHTRAHGKISISCLTPLRQSSPSSGRASRRHASRVLCPATMQPFRSQGGSRPSPFMRRPLGFRRQGRRLLSAKLHRWQATIRRKRRERQAVSVHALCGQLSLLPNLSPPPPAPPKKMSSLRNKHTPCFYIPPCQLRTRL